MYISNLKLKNYRNYDSQELSFSASQNVVYGKNAQGKTNILEAVFLCSMGRSHRTYKDIEMINDSKNALKVEMLLNKIKRENIKIEVEIDASGKKGVKINDIPIKKIGELMGYLNVVIFSPEDVGLIKGEPQNRRRFIDMFISQVTPPYFFCVQQFNKALRQRNALLRQIKEKAELIDTIDAWNDPLARNGAKIMNDRRRYIRELGKFSNENHKLLAGGNEELIMSYAPSVRIKDEDSIEEIEKKYLGYLEKNLENDILRLSTQYGPHRDVFSLALNGKDIKIYGSQGQHRSCSIALKMSQVDVMEIETGDIPVLLLDDVMSELDKERRQNITQNMKKAQTIITCTEKEIFKNEDTKTTRYFHIEEGQVKQ